MAKKTEDKTDDTTTDATPQPPEQPPEAVKKKKVRQPPFGVQRRKKPEAKPES